MKVKISKTANPQGSVLVVTIVTATIIGITLASYLTLVQNQSRSVARSQVWNNVMVVTEAGVEDGMEMINKYAGGPNLASWTNTCAADSYTLIAANTYHVQRFLEGSTVYYDVYITNSSTGPVIRSIGTVPALYAQAPSSYFYAAAGVSTPVSMSRNVVITTKKDPMFNFALGALHKIDMNGNNVTTDSFDSEDSSYSTNGLYTPSKRKGNGDIVSDDTITNTISVGNANIMGHAKTGPNGTVTVGAQGSVGDVSWVTGGSHGIQDSSYVTHDMNVQFADVPSPNSIYGNPSWYTSFPSSGSVTVDGNSYSQYVVSGGTTYIKVPSLSGKIYIGTNANVVIWVTGSTSLSSSDLITIAPQGASLTIFSGGSFSTAGNATINNQSQKAENFQLLGLPTCTSIDLHGNAAITGVIYAPEAQLTLGGGGNNTYDFVGSGLAKNVTLGGHFNFHYDEALKNRGFARGYVPTNWKESL